MKKTSFFFSCFVGFFMALQAQPTFLTLTRENVGPGNAGTISKYDAATNTISAVHTFLSEGKYPLGNLCNVSNGKYYGMTWKGGTLDQGVIFSFDLVNSTYTVVHNFDNTNGGEPMGSLIQASNGKLYGMTDKLAFDYSNPDQGSVFYSIDKNGNNYKVLRDFDHTGTSVGEGLR